MATPEMMIYLFGPLFSKHAMSSGYPPQVVRPEWKFQFPPPDRQRSRDKLRREFEELQPKGVIPR